MALTHLITILLSLQQGEFALNGLVLRWASSLLLGA